MNPHTQTGARAAARASAYRLLARLFRREVTPDLLPLVAELPGLGEALPRPFDPDEVAAEHHRVLSLQVPPWAGVFNDPEGRIGAATAAIVRDLYARAGLELDERSEEADHLAHVLELLAELEGRPALAVEVLDRALLPWLPWLVEAVERLGGPFHRALAGLTLELALDHRASLPFPGPRPSPESTEDPLADPAVGLARVARFLVTPARSGLYLSREDVRTLAADEALPSGFGSRAESMETVLRAAVELGGLERLLDGLQERVEQAYAACAALGRAGGFAAGPVALRRARLGVTERVLARLREAAREPA